MTKSVKARCRGLKYNMPLSSFLHLLGITFFFCIWLFDSVDAKRFLRYFSRRGFETHICNLPSHIEALFAVFYLFFPPVLVSPR